MIIELSEPFAANGKVDKFDVKQMKKALNRLGYYQPYEKVGITGIADMDVFEALKAKPRSLNNAKRTLYLAGGGRRAGQKFTRAI